MKIAIFDYFVIRQNAIGNCHRALFQGLQSEHEFTVFSVACDRDLGPHVRHVRVPAIARPLPLLFISYILLAPVVFALFQLRHRRPFDLIQNVEGTAPLGNVCYAHLCHAWCMDHGALIWQQEPTRLRRWSRILDHWMRCRAEKRAYRKAKVIVAPSAGLAADIKRYYPQFADKVLVINNPVQGADCPARKDKPSAADAGLQVIFSALGHFERKGLATLIRGLARTQDSRIRLKVLGGSPQSLRSYKNLSTSLGLTEQIEFAGLVDDPQQHYLQADVYAMPTAYEAFPMAVFEAAASGLPILATAVNGMAELIVEGKTGWTIRRDPADIAEKLRNCLLHKSELDAIGQAARQRALSFSPQLFQQQWRSLYQELTG